MSTACIRRNRRSRFSIINQHPRTSTELIHSLLNNSTKFRLCLGMRPTIPNRFLIEAKRRYEIAIPQIWDHKRPPFLSCFFTFNKQRQFLHSQNKKIQKLGSPWLRSLLRWKQWKFRTVPNDWQQGVRNTKHDQSNIWWRKSKHNHCLMCKNNNQRYHFANSIFRANEPNLHLIRLIECIYSWASTILAKPTCPERKALWKGLINCSSIGRIRWTGTFIRIL